MKPRLLRVIGMCFFLCACAIGATQINKIFDGAFEPVLLQTPGVISGRVMQGLTFVPQTNEWYYILGNGKDWARTSNTVARADEKGKLLDYSADEPLTFGHGQNLQHVFVDGVLTFLTQNSAGNGVSVFRYQQGTGQRIVLESQYELTNAGKNRHTTIGMSADKESLVAAYTSPIDGKTYARMFSLAALLAGPQGDRSAEAIGEICFSDSPGYDGSVKNRQHLQGVTADENYVYSLNGFWQISSAKYINVFSRRDGSLVSKKLIEAGRDIASKAGAGTIYEPEGLEWLRSEGGKLELLMGMRSGGIDGNANWVVNIGEVSNLIRQAAHLH